METTSKFIDLSRTIEHNLADPWFMRIKIKHKAHKASYWIIRLFIGLPKELFPQHFSGWADDSIRKMGVHASTHIDAPWHYGPISEGKPAKTVDQIPLDWCYGPGVKIDMRHKQELDPITANDLKEAVQKSGVKIEKGNIVLIQTGRDKFSGTAEYPSKGTGMSKEATLWLIEQGVKVMGIDQWGWDLPLNHQAKLAKEKNDKSIFWEGHLVGLEHEYCHMEQLVNLEALPDQGFKISVFPLKIKGASASPARVVAMLND